MKKIIIDRAIMNVLGGEETVFGRGSITIYVFQTAEELLDFHYAHHADLIIMDESMPVMGAAGLCAAIRNDHGLKDVSMLVITGGDEGAAARWHAVGANGVVQRPFDPADLFFKISELLVIPQRKDLRVPLRVSIIGEGEAAFIAETQNISISGMLLETERVLHKGDRLHCCFNIAHSKVNLVCTVVREREAEADSHLYGVTFVNPDMKSLIIIEQYIKSQARHQNYETSS